jgi:hypothetical protein
MAKGIDVPEDRQADCPGKGRRHSRSLLITGCGFELVRSGQRLWQLHGSTKGATPWVSTGRTSRSWGGQTGGQHTPRPAGRAVARRRQLMGPSGARYTSTM